VQVRLNSLTFNHTHKQILKQTKESYLGAGSSAITDISKAV